MKLSRCSFGPTVIRSFQVRNGAFKSALQLDSRVADLQALLGVVQLAQDTNCLVLQIVQGKWITTIAGC